MLPFLELRVKSSLAFRVEPVIVISSFVFIFRFLEFKVELTLLADETFLVAFS